MRQVTVTAPEGKGPDIAQLAFAVGVSDVSINPIRILTADGSEKTKDHIEIETATHRAKALVEKLTAAPFFNREHYTVTVRQPRSIISKAGVRALTRPLVEPTSDLFQELWQFSQVTYGFIGRIYLGALLLAFGLIEYRLLFIIAGLLFIPLLPVMLAIGFSLWTRQWKLQLPGVSRFVCGRNSDGRGRSYCRPLHPTTASLHRINFAVDGLRDLADRWHRGRFGYS